MLGLRRERKRTRIIFTKIRAAVCLSLSHGYLDVHYTNRFTRRMGGREMRGHGCGTASHQFVQGFRTWTLAIWILTCQQTFELPHKVMQREKLVYDHYELQHERPSSCQKQQPRWESHLQCGWPETQRIGPRGGVCRFEASGACRLGNQPKSPRPDGEISAVLGSGRPRGWIRKPCPLSSRSRLASVAHCPVEQLWYAIDPFKCLADRDSPER